jgi:hypothetical protein
MFSTSTDRIVDELADRDASPLEPSWCDGEPEGVEDQPP